MVENGRLIESRSYYVAHTSIQTLALLDEETNGSNWLQLSEEVGFEPTVGCPTAVFKTAAIGHSATLPQR